MLLALVVGFSPPKGTASGCGTESAALVELSPTLALGVCAEGVLRVVRAPTGDGPDAKALLMARESLMVQPGYPTAGTPPFAVTRQGPVTTTVTTAKIKAVVDMASEGVSFYDAESGAELTGDFGHSFTPATDAALDGAASHVVSQSWRLAPDEGLYGGGQFQNGLVGVHGLPVELVQYNTEAVVPFFASTRGYGLLWDNNAWSHLNPPAGAPLNLSAGGDAPGERVASFTAQADGEHAIFADMCGHAFGCGFNVELNVSVVDATGASQQVQRWDKLNNLPDSMAGRTAALRAGAAYQVRVAGAAGAKVYVTPPPTATTLSSELGQLIDYYFAYAGAAASPLDGAISGYRNITGGAPLYSKFAYGFWQCKEHYASQAELVAAAARFRAERIPLDAIVQDCTPLGGSNPPSAGRTGRAAAPSLAAHALAPRAAPGLYWGSLGWGPQWDHANYPDPAGMVANLSAAHLKLMVSTWSKFDEKTSFYKTMARRGWLLNGSTYYDAWAAPAREQFYQFAKAAHFEIGVEALWLDATEPEGFPNQDRRTARGSGNADFNSYSLQTTRAIAEGLRRDYAGAQGRRVFSLTRSSFAGQQRMGATLWSGDITGAWDALRRQVAASLNYQASGVPYWSEDIGGFFRPDGQHTSADYRVLLTRWFQFGVFTPIFRVHGTNGATELWEFGAQTQRRIVDSAIRLRYRLLPYIYSGFARVAREGYTMQRALAFDFPASARARETADEFMFGPALLVAPMVSNASARAVHLPAPAAGWRGFYDGEAHAAGGDVTAAPGLERLPLFGRAGSLLPLGPDVQHTGEKPADPLEIRVFDGADAAFTLYEDDGVSAGSAGGAGAGAGGATIELAWDDAAETLTVGATRGSFPGMLRARTLHVVRVAPGRGVGVAPVAAPDRVVAYKGEEVTVELKGLGRVAGGIGA